MKPSRRTVLQGIALAGALPYVSLAAVRASTRSLGFLVVGDWGRDGQSHQRDVAEQMGRAASAIQSQFVITVGDNFYGSGVQTAQDPQWKTSFEDVYTAPSLQTPWHAILGNHDYRGNPDAQIEYAKTNARWKMPARYYVQSVIAPDGQAVDLFMLDTSPMVRRYAIGSEDAAIQANVEGQDVAAQLRWFNEALANSKAEWKLVFGHHPVYSGGRHGSTPELIAQIEPLLERYNVCAYINGHDHDLQQIEVGSVTYIGSGAGSETRSVKRIAGTQFCSDQSGFTAYRIAGEMLSVEFRDYTGAILHTATIARDVQGQRKAG